jgi:hypothetical protein
MPNVIDKIKGYLEDTDDSEEAIEYEEAANILDRMYNLLTSLDPEKLSSDQADLFTSIIDDLADEEDEDVEENIEEAFGFTAKKVKISPALKRKRRQEYRKKRAQLKLKAKRYRKTANYKKWQRKSKRFKKVGKTATGKKIRKFI